jgi:hypothetical protein
VPVDQQKEQIKRRQDRILNKVMGAPVSSKLLKKSSQETQADPQAKKWEKYASKR